MVPSILHVACLNILLSPWTLAQLFTAIAQLEPLLETEKRIIDNLDGYIMKEDIRLAILKSYLKSYKEEHKYSKIDIPNYIENPINAFGLIKRLTFELGDIQNFIKLGKEYTESVILNHTDMKYPTLVDVSGAAQAIIRLQTTYRLDVHDLAEGRIKGVKQGNPMSAADCFALSRALYTLKDYQNTVAWSMEALRKYREKAPLSFKEVEILEYISFSHYLMGNVTTALGWTRKILELDPNHAQAQRNVPIFEKVIAEKQTESSKQEEDPDTEKSKMEDIATMTKKFGTLCRGEGEISSVVANRLHCRYMTETHPFLRLAPFKVEQLFIDPDVLLFHDVISDDEIDIMKIKATPRFSRSTASGVEVNYRVSMSAWLCDEESPAVARVTRRVADMTGFSVTSAERLQVANYGIGGHYMPHVDFFPELSNVDQGGATVFTRLGLSVVPVKGAALFWLNLLPSGEGDLNTRHAACPVLRGSKWVCTKWLREEGQEFLKPCNLEY